MLVTADLKNLAIAQCDAAGEALDAEDATTNFPWGGITSWDTTDTDLVLKYATDDGGEDSISFTSEDVSVAARAFGHDPLGAFSRFILILPYCAAAWLFIDLHGPHQVGVGMDAKPQDWRGHGRSALLPECRGAGCALMSGLYGCGYSERGR